MLKLVSVISSLSSNKQFDYRKVNNKANEPKERACENEREREKSAQTHMYNHRFDISIPE